MKVKSLVLYIILCSMHFSCNSSNLKFNIEDIEGRWKWITYDLSQEEKRKYSEEELVQFELTIRSFELSKALQQRTYNFQSVGSDEKTGITKFVLKKKNLIQFSKGFVSNGPVVYYIDKLSNDTLILKNESYIITLIRYKEPKMPEKKIPSFAGIWHSDINLQNSFKVEIHQTGDKISGSVSGIQFDTNLPFSATIQEGFSNIFLNYSFVNGNLKTSYRINVHLVREDSKLRWVVKQVGIDNKGPIPFPRSAFLYSNLDELNKNQAVQTRQTMKDTRHFTNEKEETTLLIEGQWKLMDIEMTDKAKKRKSETEREQIYRMIEKKKNSKNFETDTYHFTSKGDWRTARKFRVESSILILETNGLLSFDDKRYRITEINKDNLILTSDTRILTFKRHNE